MFVQLFATSEYFRNAQKRLSKGRIVWFKRKKRTSCFLKFKKLLSTASFLWVEEISVSKIKIEKWIFVIENSFLESLWSGIIEKLLKNLKFISQYKSRVSCCLLQIILTQTNLGKGKSASSKYPRKLSSPDSENLVDSFVDLLGKSWPDTHPDSALHQPTSKMFSSWSAREYHNEALQDFLEGWNVGDGESSSLCMSSYGKHPNYISSFRIPCRYNQIYLVFPSERQSGEISWTSWPK